MSRRGPTARRPAGGSRRPSRPACAGDDDRAPRGPGAGTARLAALDAPVARGARRAVPRARPWRRRSRPPAGAGRASVAGRTVPVRSAPTWYGSCGSSPCSVGRYTAPGLEQPQSAGAAGAVVAGDVEQRPEQRRAQPRLLGRERVLELDRVAQRVLGRGAAGRRSSGPVKLQPTISFSPWAASASAARRRRRCRASAGRRRRGGRGAWPAAYRAPSSRATSSIRSTSRVTSARRKAGAGRRGRRRRRATSNSSASRISRWRARAERRPRAGPRPARRAARIVSGAGPGPPTSIVPGPRSRAAQLDHQLGRHGLRLHRLLGLELLLEAARGLAAQPELRARCGGCWGRPSSRPPSARASCSCSTSERAPPITPAIEVGPVGVLDQHHLRRRACGSGRRASATCSPSRARRTVSGWPSTRSRSNACSGWPVSSIT